MRYPRSNSCYSGSNSGSQARNVVEVENKQNIVKERSLSAAVAVVAVVLAADAVF